MTFKQWIDKQPFDERPKVKKGIAEACAVSSETVRKWIAEQYSPKPHYRNIINSIAGEVLIYNPQIKKASLK